MFVSGGLPTSGLSWSAETAASRVIWIECALFCCIQAPPAPVLCVRAANINTVSEDRMMDWPMELATLHWDMLFVYRLKR